jgi:hypothetical protein
MAAVPTRVIAKGVKLNGALGLSPFRQSSIYSFDVEGLTSVSTSSGAEDPDRLATNCESHPALNQHCQGLNLFASRDKLTPSDIPSCLLSCIKDRALDLEGVFASPSSGLEGESTCLASPMIG